jgi:glutathione-regulated potassium-efflux system ancillary protein KefF
MMVRVASVAILYAHPYPDRSRAGRTLVSAVREIPRVTVRTLYELYPDFAIDVEREQALLVASDVIVWQAPFYWYGLPALMHLWFEKVLAQGWAYGEGGNALCGKSVLLATTTGGVEPEYREGARHGHPFETFLPPLAQTARFCGMTWLDPLVVRGAHRIDDDTLRGHAARYRTRIRELTQGAHG